MAMVAVVRVSRRLEGQRPFTIRPSFDGSGVVVDTCGVLGSPMASSVPDRRRSTTASPAGRLKSRTAPSSQGGGVIRWWRRSTNRFTLRGEPRYPSAYRRASSRAVSANSFRSDRGARISMPAPYIEIHPLSSTVSGTVASSNCLVVSCGSSF